MPHKPGFFLESCFLFHDRDTRLDCGISHISSLAAFWATPFLLVLFLFSRVLLTCFQPGFMRFCVLWPELASS